MNCYELVVTKTLSHDTDFVNVGHSFDDVQIMKVTNDGMNWGL